jgi:hypothetical protein
MNMDHPDLNPGKTLPVPVPKQFLESNKALPVLYKIKIKSQLNIYMLISLLLIRHFLISVVRLRFSHQNFALFTPSGSGSAFWVWVRIQAPTECGSNAHSDLDPKHWVPIEHKIRNKKLKVEHSSQFKQIDQSNLFVERNVGISG